MKRLTALLLCAMLLLVATGAGAASLPGYTLDEKLFKQVKDGSGFAADILFTKTGGAFSALDEASNAFVGAVLPGSNLSLKSLRGVGIMKGMEDLSLTATKGETPLFSLQLSKDLQFEQLTTSLLGNQPYVDARDGGAIRSLLGAQPAIWPDALGLVFGVNSAESSWQTAVKQKLDAYTVKTTLWLQTYTSTQSLRDQDNQLQNRIAISVPAAQVKAFLKQLLLDVYADAELLALLQKELDKNQAAAYLQPAMLSSFFVAIDQLPLSGELVSLRLLDATGQLLENQLVLPLGGAYGIDQLSYQFAAATGQTTVSLRFLPTFAGNQKGALVDLVMSEHALEGEQKQYTGTFSHQPEAGTPGFTVDPEEGDVPAQVYAFDLLTNPQPEVLDEAGTASTRTMSFALTLTPQGQSNLSKQSLTGDITLQSRRNSASATSFTGTLVWLDEGSLARLQADIKGNSTPPYSIPAINPDNSIRLDQMTQAQLVAATQQAQTSLAGALAAMVLTMAAP